MRSLLAPNDINCCPGRSLLGDGQHTCRLRQFNIDYNAKLPHLIFCFFMNTFASSLCKSCERQNMSFLWGGTRNVQSTFRWKSLQDRNKPFRYINPWSFDLSLTYHFSELYKICLEWQKSQCLMDWVGRPIILDSIEDHDLLGWPWPDRKSKSSKARRKLDFTYKAKTGNKWREVEEKNKA